MDPTCVVLWTALQPSPASADPPPSSSPGQRAVMFVDAGARDARRRRRIRNTFDLSLGAVQVGVGTYALVSLSDRGPGIRRHAIKEVVVGGSAIVVGAVFLGLPTQMEKLRRDPEYLRVLDHPDDPGRVAALERQWRKRAKIARTLRHISGSLTLVAGAGLATWGVVSLAVGDPDRSDGAAVWAVVTTTGGAYLMARGGLDLALKSPAEEAWDAYSAERSPTAGPRISLSPTLGGASISGRF